MKLISLRALTCIFCGGLGMGAMRASASAVLVPVADTYVASGTPTTVEGTANSMVANQSTNVNHRWSYVRFDLSAIDPATIGNLELDLHNTGAGGALTTINVYGLVNNENFSEGGLTFANDPNASGNFFNTASAYGTTPLASFVSNSTGNKAGTDVAFNVASGPVFNFLNADADKIVTFVLDEQVITTNSGQAWSTKEDTTAANRPALIVSTPEPAALSMLALGSIAMMGRRRRA